MSGRSAAIAFAIVCTSVVLATLDQFVVNIAFRAIEVDLRSDAATVSWVLNAYSIVFAALLVPAGRLADRSGRTRGFVVGVALFTAASAACAAAPSIGWLIAARVAQAAGAATLMPSSLGLLLAIYPDERRARAVRIWTAVTGAAAALGPVVGGVLTGVSWRWIFLVNIPIGVAALIGARRRLPAVEPHGGPLPDLLGAVVLAAAIGALSLGLVGGDGWGWTSTRVLGAGAAALLLLACFVVRSARHPCPVVELSLLRLRKFRFAALALVVNCVGFAAMLLAMFLWMQTAWHWSTTRQGLAFLPGPLLVPLFAYVSGKAIARVGLGVTACVGALAHAAAALVFFAQFDGSPDYLTGLLPGSLLTGVGVGLAMPTMMAGGADFLPRERLATGSAILTMARQVGFSIGVAVLVAVLAANEGLHAYRVAWLVIAGLGGFGAALALLLGLPQAPRRVVTSQPVEI